MRKKAESKRTPSHYFVLARDIAHEQRATNPWAWADWTENDTTITSDMHRGYVVPDGWDEVHFNRGATITVNAAAPTLTLLTFRTSIEEKLANPQH